MCRIRALAPEGLAKKPAVAGSFTQTKLLTTLMISKACLSIATNRSLSLKIKPIKSLARNALTLYSALQTIEGIFVKLCAIFRYFAWPVRAYVFISRHIFPGLNSDAQSIVRQHQPRLQGWTPPSALRVN